MKMWTVRIEASGDGATWQEMHPAEDMQHPGPAQQVAEDVAANQTVAEGASWRVRVWPGADANQTHTEGAGWRVRVWEGADADTGAEPAAEWISPDPT